MEKDLREGLKYLNTTDLNKIKDILQKELDTIDKKTREEYSLSCLIKRVECEIEYIKKYGQDMTLSKEKIKDIEKK